MLQHGQIKLTTWPDVHVVSSTYGHVVTCSIIFYFNMLKPTGCYYFRSNMYFLLIELFSHLLVPSFGF